jgi:hypothetical protein
MAPLIDLQYQHIEQAFGREVFDDLFDSLETFIDAQKNPVLRVALPPVAPTAE